VARRRARWKNLQPRLEPERLVFIDETWTKTNMAPLRGWAPRGARLVAKVPHGHWKTTTFLAALRHDHIAAPWVVDGPIDGESFFTYVEKVLVPILRPGDIVILDNLGSHKGKRVRALVRAAGARLIFLPKYSPDMNPPSSSTCCEELPPEPSTICARQSAENSRPSHRRNAPTTSPTPDMRKPKCITL
jgi:hypothetical protein